MFIRIKLHRERSKPGTLELVRAGETLLGPLMCLGEADREFAISRGNPDRDPKLCFGHTPTGIYVVREWVPYQEGKTVVRTFGTETSLQIDPDPDVEHAHRVGDAWEAERNGRSGIMIHAGDLSPEGKLRPTHGCIRLYERDQASLIKKLEEMFTLTGMSRHDLRVEISEITSGD